MQVLVVDDEAVIRAGCAEAFRLAGHEVVTAGDGIEALHHLQARQFDLMVLDLVMPNMNGLELLTEAKHRGILHCTVFAVTAFSREWCDGIKEIAQVLIKPVNNERMVECAEAILQKD